MSQGASRRRTAKPSSPAPPAVAGDVFHGLADTEVTRWFAARFPGPTPAQSRTWPALAAGRNVLLVSPTGTGKTLAAFLAVLNALAADHARGELAAGIQAVYVSPLRALSYDLEKNLRGPLEEIYGADSPLRVALRTGDTPTAERQRQFREPPHLLLTTPESLLILLSQTRWLDALRRVRWVIVDEVHALAENKRGAHLSLSLERLEALVATAGTPGEGNASAEAPRLQRVGLSATVAPLDEVAHYLVGTGRACEIVDVSATKRIELRVHSPLTENPYPPAGFTGARMMGELAELVRQHRTTLVFTNTRSGAEAASFWLRQNLPELASQVECHHASLDRDLRLDVEDRLKRGELRAVVCSTSLELGIDIGSVDLVVMLATPKGVSKALQRAGRAGHEPGKTSRGLLMATNVSDLVECCATVRLAEQRQLDGVRLPVAPLDVLAQHLVGMGCVGRWTRAEALALVRRSYLYRALTDDEFAEVLDYLAGGGKSLRQQYTEVFGKIELDADGFLTRAGAVQRDYLQNAGTIPSEGSVHVRLRGRSLGSVEESFMRGLQVGDVFMIAGRAVRLLRTGGLEAVVERADHATPTVPRWNANKMPLSNRVADEIAAFRREIRARLEAAAASMGDLEREHDSAELARWVDQRLTCGPTNAALILRLFRVQHRCSEIPTDEFLLIEELETHGEAAELAPVGTAPDAARPRRGRRSWREREHSMRATQPARHYFVHSLIGRAANDALSRVVARRLGQGGGGNVLATPDDYGFVLTVAREQRLSLEDLPRLLSPEGFTADLVEGLKRSELLKYHFRNAAQTGLMVYRNYFGERKSLRKLQWSAEVIFNVLSDHEPDHVLLREARRDALGSFLDGPGAEAYLRRLVGLPMRLRRVEQVAPLSFAMYASKLKEALLVEDPRETLERLFHLWWDKVQPSTAETATPPSTVG